MNIEKMNEKLDGLIEMLERAEKELNENLQVFRKDNAPKAYVKRRRDERRATR